MFIMFRFVWNFVPEVTTRHRQRTKGLTKGTLAPIASRLWLQQKQCNSLAGSLPLSWVIFVILCITQSRLILHHSGNTKNTTQRAVGSTSHLLFISGEGFHWCFRLSLASTATSMSHSHPHHSQNINLSTVTLVEISQPQPSVRQLSLAPVAVRR